MEPKYEVKTKVSFEMYQEYVRIITRRRLFIIAAVEAIWVLLAIMEWTARNTRMVILLGVLFVAYPIIFQLLWNRVIRRTYAATEAANGTSTKISFYEDHMTTRTKKTHETRFNYADLKSIRETDSAYYFMVQKNNGIILPKEQCGSDVQSFVQSIIARHGEKKIKG